MWRIQHAHTNVCVRMLMKKSSLVKRFQYGASAAATALLVEVSVAGIVITMLPSTSEPSAALSGKWCMATAAASTPAAAAARCR